MTAAAILRLEPWSLVVCSTCPRPVPDSGASPSGPARDHGVGFGLAMTVPVGWFVFYISGPPTRPPPPPVFRVVMELYPLLGVSASGDGLSCRTSSSSRPDSKQTRLLSSGPKLPWKKKEKMAVNPKLNRTTRPWASVPGGLPFRA